MFKIGKITHYENGNIGIEVDDKFEFLINKKESGNTLLQIKAIKWPDWNISSESFKIAGDEPDLVIPAVLEGIPINYIEESVFSAASLNTDAIKTIAYLYIDDGIEVKEGAFFECPASIKKIRWSGYPHIPNECFCKASSLEEITNISSVTVIEEEAFAFCNSLKKFEFPEGLTKIGNQAFRNCKSLEKVNIPDSVTEIGKSAFFGCVQLNKVHWPAACKNIPPYCFSTCVCLTDVSGIDNIESIGTTAFESTALRDFVIPSNCSSIEAGVFYNCPNLISVQTEDGGVLSLSPHSFQYNKEDLVLDFSKRLAISGIDDLQNTNIIRPFYSIY